MEYFDGDAKYSGKSSIKGIQTIGNLFARSEAPIQELKNYLDCCRRFVCFAGWISVSDSSDRIRNLYGEDD